MLKRYCTVNAILLLLFTSLFAQAQTKGDSLKVITMGDESPTIQTRYLLKRKHKMFVYWGYNRAAYMNSDIHFKGNGYDFSIYNVMARDIPTTDFGTYIDPLLFTVPQYNARVGYYLNDQTFISVGQDHMKYIIYKQPVFLTGIITKDNNEGSNIGTYNNTEVLVGEGGDAPQGNGNYGASIINNLPKGFVTNYKHCDGLNYFDIAIGRNEQVWISKNRKDALSIIGMAGMGPVITDTEADVLGYPSSHIRAGDKKGFHLSGYGFSGSIGLQFDFCKHWFLLSHVKGGYVNLPDILTTQTGDRASQHIFFEEAMMVVGYTFQLKK